MKQLFTLLLCLALPAQALALSCIRPDARRTFQTLAVVPEPYVVVTGRITMNEALLPRTDHVNLPPDTTDLPARIEGMALNQRGFVTPYSRDITLRAQCFAGWCGGLGSGTDILAFIERTDQGDRLTIDPCGGHAFPEPSTRVLAQMQSCLTGGPCRPAD